MKLLKFILCFNCALLSFQAQAQTILPNISHDIGAAATKNIEKAERLFCYHIANKPQNYNGYTIDNFAITGFCGILDPHLKDMLVEQLFSTNSNINFGNINNCTIEPRIMLRFVRGIDSTDVLLSNPCPSATIFYAGKVSTYNMKPATELLETITTAFNNTQTSFVSPALLNQLLPIGVVQTSEQRAAVSAPEQAKRNWSTGSSASPQKNGGWNSLNFK